MDRTAIVTGAGSGIGREAAIAFARRGVRLMLLDVDSAGGEKTKSQVEALGAEAAFRACDVTSSAQLAEAFNMLIARWGRLDFAYNNAAIAGADELTNEYPEDDWNRVLAVNLTGVWLCMKYEIDQMLTNGGGRIVNASSIGGLVGYQGGSAYIAAKHGVLGLTKTAAIEFGTAGIRINSVCPGYVDTPMIATYGPVRAKEWIDKHPVKRLAEPSEIAQTVVWLCMDAPDFLTGQGLTVDGGYTAQ